LKFCWPSRMRRPIRPISPIPWGSHGRALPIIWRAFAAAACWWLLWTGAEPLRTRGCAVGPCDRGPDRLVLAVDWATRWMPPSGPCR